MPKESATPKFDEIYSAILGEKKKTNKSIYHTWATHAVHRECTDKGTGRVVHHTLTEQGEIEFYNVKWENGTVETNIPASLLELTIVQEHSHGPKKKKD